MSRIFVFMPRKKNREKVQKIWNSFTFFKRLKKTILTIEILFRKGNRNTSTTFKSSLIFVNPDYLELKAYSVLEKRNLKSLFIIFLSTNSYIPIKMLNKRS